MLAFDTDRLASGKQQVDAIFENSDIHGYDVIRCALNKISDPNSAVTQPIGGFERINEHGDLDIGVSYFYPDKKGRSWLFLPSTKHNRFFLKHSMADTLFSIIDQRIKAELTEECQAEGIRTTPRPIDLGFDNFSAKEKQQKATLERKVDEVAQLRAQLNKVTTEKAVLEIEKEDLEKEAELATQEVKIVVSSEEDENELIEEVVVVKPTPKPKPATKKKVTSKVTSKK